MGPTSAHPPRHQFGGTPTRLRSEKLDRRTGPPGAGSSCVQDGLTPACPRVSRRQRRNEIGSRFLCSAGPKAPADGDRGEADPGKEKERCRHIEPRRDQPRAGPGELPEPIGGGLVVAAAGAAAAHICAAASSGEIEGDGLGPPSRAQSWTPSMPWAMYCRPVSMSTSTRDPAPVVPRAISYRSL